MKNNEKLQQDYVAMLSRPRGMGFKATSSREGIYALHQKLSDERPP
jgi:hypothetical protein